MSLHCVHPSPACTCQGSQHCTITNTRCTTFNTIGISYTVALLRPLPCPETAASPNSWRVRMRNEIVSKDATHRCNGSGGEGYATGKRSTDYNASSAWHRHSGRPDPLGSSSASVLTAARRQRRSIQSALCARGQTRGTQREPPPARPHDSPRAGSSLGWRRTKELIPLERQVHKNEKKSAK